LAGNGGDSHRNDGGGGGDTKAVGGDLGGSGRGGNRKKKRKKGKRSNGRNRAGNIEDGSGGGNSGGAAGDASNNAAATGSATNTNNEDLQQNHEGGGKAASFDDMSHGREDIENEEDDMPFYHGAEESSIFGQTTGSSNSTWVECDKCKKWRRLRGVVDAKKLPSKWYCTMNRKDPERAKCSAPEEEYNETPNTPESATDQRTRKHLRLWVRRLQCNEHYEARLPTMTRGKRRNNISSSKEPYEWVRCCNPSCGKWRALLRSMEASSSVMDSAKNGEWYCVLNTWDEKTASCAAPQENLPAIGCPPWVMQDSG